LLLWVAACGPSAGTGHDRDREPINPDAPATHEQCEQALDHVFAMPTANLSEEEVKLIEDMKSRRDEFVKMCEQNASQTDFDCLMRATTMQELGRCPPPHRGGGGGGETPPPG
jgi:hypothetical protein